MEKVVTITNSKDWVFLVQEVCTILAANPTMHIVALTGDLGVGKTTFVQTLAKTLGVSETVTSPTFTIMKQYPIKPFAGYTTLVHIDAYRIEDVLELRPLRFEEMRTERTFLFCIEWAERIKSVLPKEVLSVHITHHANEVRIVHLVW